jgi:peptidyl-tRNA hydrolase
LYVIGREDLGSGYMSVQAMHAAIQFQHDYPEHATTWYKQSNYLGFLSVSNEDELGKLISKATNLGIKFSVFREPDINDQVTAIALEPGVLSRKLCSNLKLALRGNQ